MVTNSIKATAMIVGVFNAAVQKNNHAVRLLQAGRNHEASILFQHAILSTRALLKKMKDGNILLTSNRVIRYKWSVAPLSAATGGDSFVFGRALSILPPADNNEVPNIRAASTIFLFNLGLSFHLQAAGSNQKELFEKALGCYCIAMTMRKKYRRKEHGQLFDLGLANNVAEIHRLLHNYQEASVHYKIMKQHLNALNQRMLTTEDAAGFIFNLACFAEPRMASAA